MENDINRIAVYLILARVCELRARPFVSDKLWLLAGATAVRQLLPKTAAACRQRILTHNPQHAVGHTATMEQALRDAEFQAVLKRVEQQYSPEHAEFLLAKLNFPWEKTAARSSQPRRLLAELLHVEPSELDDCLD